VRVPCQATLFESSTGYRAPHMTDFSALLEGLHGDERRARLEFLERSACRGRRRRGAYELRGIGEPVPALRAFTTPAR
jgi:hypothetical protein